MSFSHMKEGVAKVKLCYILFHPCLLNIKWLGAPDVDGLRDISLIDVYHSICVYFGDVERPFGWRIHLSFASAFVCVEDNKDLITA